MSTDAPNQGLRGCLAAHPRAVHPIQSEMVRRGRIMRRQDLLRAGHTDRQIRWALAHRYIFRVRHGWYALPDIADEVARAVRVGGRLTGLAALRTLDMFLPPPSAIDLAVPRTAARLRRPTNRRERLDPADGVRINWIESPRGDRDPWDWIASEDDALFCVLVREDRETAIACCDGLVRYRGWTSERLKTAFERAPKRVQGWLALVDGRADAWGETVVRLRLGDVGIPFVPQPRVAGVGRLDGKVSPHVFIEIDGRQHDPDWSGDSASSFEGDHDRDLVLAALGARSIRITYRQLEHNWDVCLKAICGAIEADTGKPVVSRPKRRRSGAIGATRLKIGPEVTGSP